MLRKGLNRGAISPLLLFLKRTAIGSVAALVVSCSSHSPPSALYAGGYLSDRGVMRVWRKDDPTQQQTALMTVFSPFNGHSTQITRYHFRQNAVREITQSKSAPDKEDVRLRFDAKGAVSYMQRQLPDRREPLSDDDIALYQFDAGRLLEMSDAMRTGNVQLKQGQWQDGVVVTCSGQRIRPSLDHRASQRIAQRQQRSAVPLSIAWLESREGTQLLLVANEDFCRWEPTVDSLQSD